MAQQTIFADSQRPFGGPNGGISTEFGDTWDVTAAKINAMFTELYAAIAVAPGDGLTLVGGTLSIAPAGVTNAMLANSFIVLGSTSLSLGGTYNLINGSLTFGGTVNFSGSFEIGGTPVTLPVSVPNGGTGVGTLTANGVLYGGGTGNISATSVNNTATNKFLTQANGFAPSWATIQQSDLPQMAAWTIKGNPTNAIANESDFTIDGLTLKGTPASADEVILWDVAGSAIKKATVSSLSLGVSYFVPGGRLTLTSGTAVTTSDVTGATTIYYTPDATDNIWIYNGTFWAPLNFTELSLALDSTNTDTGYQQSGFNFDLFVVNDSGTRRLGTGPAWSSDTSRGAGAGTTELQLLNGLWTNKNSITLRYGSATGNTLSIPANQALYVGTMRATANGITEDSAVKRFLWNAYNQALRPMLRNEAANTNWTYSTAAYRQANANASNQLDFVCGLAGVMVRAKAIATMLNSTSTQRVYYVGIGLDQTAINNASVTTFATASNAVGASALAEYDGYPGLGRHFLAWLEYGNGTDTQTWYADNGAGTFKSGMVGSLLG